MTYYTIITTNAYGTCKFVNIRNLGQAILFAIRFSRDGESTVIDQGTGAIMAILKDGEPTYVDADPYAGY